MKNLSKQTIQLAVYGGKPVRNNFLPYTKQFIGEQEIKKVVEVLRSDWITTGPVVQAFEQQLAKRAGAKYAVSVNSGTAALHIGCLSLGLKPGDEVITTPMTFVATANAVLYCGAKPIFVDIDPHTLNIDPTLIESKITNKTVGIIPVHFAGEPCDMDPIHRLARKYRLWVLEDAAHALGAKYKKKSIGGLSDVSIFSFHPAKNITTGEGGMALTNQKEVYKKLLMYRTHGIEKDAWKRKGAEGDWFYDMELLGFRYNMTELQAALGLVQLKRLNSFQKTRNQIVSLYNKSFQNLTEWEIPVVNKNTQSSWHLYVLKWIKKGKPGLRDKIIKALRSENIGAHLHYRPVYRHLYYQNHFKINPKEYPIAEKVSQQIVTLPLFPKMTKADALSVVEAVKKVTAYYG